MSEHARSVLREYGRDPGGVLGVGVEGTVVDLPPAQVAKVWHGRELKDLERLVQFGNALGRSTLPFGTSRATELLSGGSMPVTIEQKVFGRPVRLDNLVDPPPVSDREARLMGDALAGLAEACDADLAVLPILRGEPAFDVGRPFASELADLVQRQFDAHRDLLRASVADIDVVVEGLVRGLRDFPVGEPARLIHGDLIPANVLVEREVVVGVVDFGFMTTLGDPAFDAAISASIFDMYGEHGRESERALSEAFIARFGHDSDRYGVYRAAYAVVTSMQFSDDGQDGHFAWCMAMLQRDDVRDAVLR